ncbi:MAG TPA: YfhO family protein [Bacteroidota bacterium]|nr:YfhO family protein [Bacteroidota bacterium]
MKSTKPKNRDERRRVAAHADRTAAHHEPADWQCLAILAGLVAVFFHKILLGQAYFWEDFIYQNYPFRVFAATSLAQGELPLWNPYTFNGMPFLADIQTTVLYVPSLLLTLFVSNGTLHHYWLEVMIILHFVLAGVGMFYLAKSFGVNNLPALFAGSAYMFSGYMIVHAIHQQNLTLVAWYPLVVLLFRKALSEQRWLYVFVCSLVLGHSILAGYPQLSLYLYTFLGAYFLFELLTTFKGRELLSRQAFIMTAKAAGIVVLSVGLAMIQLLPTFELSDLSQRAQITFEKASEGSLAWAHLATLLFPKMFGAAGATGYEYFGPGQYFYYWETCIYLGVIPFVLMLAALSLRKRRYVAFFAGVSLFSILFALGENFPLFRLFYELVPGFSKFRIPARMGILLTFSAALLSAFSLQHVMYELEDARRRTFLKKMLLSVAGAGVVLYGLILSGSFSGAIRGATFSQVAGLVSEYTTPSLFVLLLSIIAVYLVVDRKLSARTAGLGLVIVFCVDMFVFGGSQNNGAVNPTEYFRQRRDLVEQFKREGEKEFFRVNTRNAHGLLPGWDRNQGMVDRIFTMEGYTPLALQRAYAPLASNDQSFDLLNVKYKTVFDEHTGRQTLVEHATRLPRAFFVYAVHVTTTEEELLAYLKSPAFDHRTVAVLEEQPSFTLSSPASVPMWSARITRYRNNEIVIEAETSHDGLLVLSEIFYPGWKAYVDGKETHVYRTNYHLRGMHVPAGKHTVEVRFEPSSFRTGLWVSVAVLVICGVGIAASVSRQKH